MNKIIIIKNNNAVVNVNYIIYYELKESALFIHLSNNFKVTIVAENSKEIYDKITDFVLNNNINTLIID